MAPREEFLQYNWNSIAKTMGGRLQHVDKARGEVHMYLPPLASVNNGGGSRTIIVSDNGGEVNICERVPAIDWSVPYTGWGLTVGPITLAWRLFQALTGKREHEIDWTENPDLLGEAPPTTTTSEGAFTREQFTVTRVLDDEVRDDVFRIGEAVEIFIGHRCPRIPGRLTSIAQKAKRATARSDEGTMFRNVAFGCFYHPESAS